MKTDTELLLEDYKKLYKEAIERNKVYEQMIKVLLTSRLEAEISLKQAEEKCSQIYYSKYEGENPFGLVMKNENGWIAFLD